MKYLIPIVILVAAVVATVALVKSRPVPATKAPLKPSVLVSVQEVQRQPVRFSVRSQGSVVARTQTTLVTEVPGRVVEVSPALAAGGKFVPSQMLVRIDPSDFETDLKQARASLKKAETQVATENALAGNALKDWQRLRSNSLPSELTLRKPQLAEALAELESRRAELERAERNLERTTLGAPYQGLVMEKLVDVGQYLNVGASVARVFATDVVEVRLPLTQQDLQFVDLERLESGGELAVELEATVGGEKHRWSGRILRSEGVFDPLSRVLHLVAVVDDPYNLENTHQQSLRLGTFVVAEIEGRDGGELFVLPRHALDANDRVWIVNDELELQPREVTVVRRDERFAYVAPATLNSNLSDTNANANAAQARVNGDRTTVETQSNYTAELTDGDLVCITPVNQPLPGMSVRLRENSKLLSDSNSAGVTAPRGNSSDRRGATNGPT